MHKFRTTLLAFSFLVLSSVTSAQAEFDVMKVQGEGFAAMEQNDWPTAIEKFKSLVEYRPTEALFETNLGFVLMQSGASLEAIPHLIKATELNPDLETPWMNLGRAYQSTNQAEKEIDALERFAKMTKDPAKARDAHALAVSTREAMGKRVVDDSPTDYFKTVTANGNRERWTAERQPVKVFIEDDSQLALFKPEFIDATKQAFTEWGAATGDKVKFEFVPNKSDAYIDVRFVATQKELRDPGEAGECLKLTDGKGIHQAHVAIGLFSKELDREYIHCLALHEAGHSIGLAGHSWVPEDIMYIAPAAAVRKTIGLTSRDKETARRFYNDDIGESWLTLNNRGLELEKKNDFQGALDCYTKALKINDDPVISLNLAALYYNWAQTLWHDGDSATAAGYFKNAWDMQSKKPDKNFNLMQTGYSKFLRSQQRDDEALAVEKARN